MARFAERFLHVDMDAFFVEVERQHDPALVGRPVIVGGLGRRGVVASASYEARSFGVRSAMPIGEARRLCPQGRYLAPSHGRYGEKSREVFDVFRSFTPHVEGLSVDEAFMDISGLRLHYDSPAAVGAELRRVIRERTGLPSSVGISAVKFISKLASDAAKPDGQLVVPVGEELSFLHPMPVRRLWGVGEATHASLEALGVKTVGDLAAVSEPVLRKRLGSSLAHHLSNLAAAIDPRDVELSAGAQSISVEETYESDLSTDEDVQHALLRLCDRLSRRLHRAHRAGRTVQLKVRFGDFETVSRSESLENAIDVTPDLWDEARALLDKVELGGRGVRLIGIGLSGLIDAEAPRQLSMDSPERSIVAEAAEQVRERFGDDAVLPASVIRDRAEKRRGG